MGPSVSKASPSYELTHPLSPDQDTTSSLFVDQRPFDAPRSLETPAVRRSPTSVGEWTRGIAKKIGVDLPVEALKDRACARKYWSLGQKGKMQAEREACLQTCLKNGQAACQKPCFLRCSCIA